MAHGDRATLCSGRPQPTSTTPSGWAGAHPARLSHTPPGRGAGGYFHLRSIYNVCSYKQGSKNNSSVPLGCPEMLNVALGLERLELFRAWSEKPDYGKSISGCCDLYGLSRQCGHAKDQPAPAKPWGCRWMEQRDGEQRAGPRDEPHAGRVQAGVPAPPCSVCCLCRWPSCC